jgi:hypothetical protein
LEDPRPFRSKEESRQLQQSPDRIRGPWGKDSEC